MKLLYCHQVIETGNNHVGVLDDSQFTNEEIHHYTVKSQEKILLSKMKCILIIFKILLVYVGIGSKLLMFVKRL